MTKKTRQWVRKAEADFRASIKLETSDEPFHDQICFHCQQSTEKYMKALIEERGMPVPKIHDLDKLLDILSPYEPSLQSFRRATAFLSNYAVTARYPGFDANKRTATAALRWAGKVREACRDLLGIRPPRRKSK